MFSNMSTNRTLIEKEYRSLILIIQGLSSVENFDQLGAHVDGPLKGLIPHQSFLCGLSQAVFDHFEPLKIIIRNFPSGYLDEISDPATKKFNTPLVDRWLKTGKPQLFDVERDGDKIGREHSDWSRRFDQYDLQNVIAHGVNDLKGMISFFAFYRIPGGVGKREAHLLELLVPQLHVAVIRCIAKEKVIAHSSSLLSEQQREVLFWMYRMKTNWEIAQILGISQNTVKYHVKEILFKLDATCRADAISKALQMDSIKIGTNTDPILELRLADARNGRAAHRGAQPCPAVPERIAP